MVGILDPNKYGEYFYEFYTSNTRRKLKKDRKTLSRRKRKDKKAAAMAAAAAVLEGNAGAIVNPIDPPLVKDNLNFPTFPVVNIDLDANASKFAVFSAIRSSVLEAETRYAMFENTEQNLNFSSPLACCLVCTGTCSLGNLADCSCHAIDKEERYEYANSESAESDADELPEKEAEIIRVPLIVGAGLRSLFELIADARHMQPVLCTKALKSLLDVIQGQKPESFKLEPDDLIMPLYELLMDLATMPASTTSTAATTKTTTKTTTTQQTTKNIHIEADWSAMACAALIGLCIARGDTGKILKAITALLMSPKQLTTQVIQLPAVLRSLQRTVLCAALNKPIRPDFHTRGVPHNSLLDEFPLKSTAADNKTFYSQPAMATDGTYLYLLLDCALLKIGTGYGGSYKGHIYAQNDEFTKEKSGWLGFCGGQLYFRRNSKRSADHLHSVKMDTLTIKSICPLNIPPNREGSQFVLFADEDSLNAICTNRDDTLVVKHLNSFYNKCHYYGNESSAVFELPLQLARKKFRTLGYAAFEDEVLNQNQIQKIQSNYNLFEPKLPNDADVQDIACGKEFGLVRATNGKVYYYGKSASMGLKAVGRTPSMKMTELIVSKISKISHVAVGHDGIHALLVNDDGTVYFTGTARRGEDGDSSKNRRQPKAVKPKKMSKIEGYVIVHAACNNGTSAFVTKSGKLIMYGKDTAHCDVMGFVTDFSEQHITKVALGKAHCVVLNAKGQLFTFGLNNKGQCGRVFKKSKDISTFSSNTTTTTTSSSSSNSTNNASTSPAQDNTNDKISQALKKIKFDLTNLCDYDDHALVQGPCRVCVMCRECTGYNVSCVSTMNISLEDRVAGTICACGHGDAGCSKCGMCSTCISVQENEHGVLGDSKETTKSLVNELCRQRSKTLVMRRKDKKYAEDDNNSASTSAMESAVAAGSTDLALDKDPPRVAPLAPQMLVLPTNSPVVQIACGLHHTVVLTLSGDVFTFGSNQYGQLGTDDLAAVSGLHKVQLPAGVKIIQVAAGSNHTVLLTEKGVVYTFGNYQKGQLGRLPNEMHRQAIVSNNEAISPHKGSPATGKVFLGSSSSRNNTTAMTVTSLHDATVITNNLIVQRQKFLWNCSLGSVFGLGPSFGKRATWIGASGDQTFIKIDESLITSQMLSKVNVVANKYTILLIPTIPLAFNMLTINRRDGSCTAHYKQQVNFVQLMQNNNKIPTLPEINRNSVSVPTAGPIPEQMSRSMHEARNQIFDLQDQHQLSNSEQQQHQKRRLRKVEQAASSSNSDNLLMDHQSHPQIAFALDSVFNVLWVYNGAQKKLLCYNVLCSEMEENATNSKIFHSILTSELSLPYTLQARVQRSQASLNLLACLDILTSAHDSIPRCFDEVVTQTNLQIKDPLHDEYQIVNRFENFGGGWGYSGHSVEAIRFSVDAEVIICGFGMFGGRGEYTCKLKLYDLGNEGGGYEKEGILISESKEVPYECAARSKHHVMLPKPVTAAAGRWYLLWARIAGPSSDCGSCGQATVTTEDQITFTFKSSKKANNGTDVNSGQIPAILYRHIAQELKQPSSAAEFDPIQKVSKNFANSVSRECFESLVILLQWAWDKFKLSLREQRTKSNQLEVRQSLCYLSYVTKFCLRLLRKYTNEIYPHRVDFVNSSTVAPLKFHTNTNAKTKALAKSAKISNCNEPKGMYVKFLLNYG